MACGTAAMVIEPKAFDKGLVFVKDTDILLSGDKWTIVLNIALDDYTFLIEDMKSMINYIRQRIQMHQNPRLDSFDIHWEEVNRLDKMVRELAIDLQSLQKLLFKETPANVRPNRGLLNILGYGLKYLFGTADAKDVKTLMKICDDFHVFKVAMMHATEQQMAYIRALDRMTKQNVMDTVELARALRDSVEKFSLRLNRVEADLLDTQEAMMKQMRYSAAIREI
jgi:DNA-binding ferritin-like protein (Dps family)